MIRISGKKLCSNCFFETDKEPCPACGYKKSADKGDPSVLSRGTRLGGKYILGGALGRGGFGITYLAYDSKAEKTICVKEYFPRDLAYRAEREKKLMTFSEKTYKSYKEGEESFFNESETVSQFNGNPNIVNVYESFHENNTAYYAMEYLNGVTLEKYVCEKGALTCAQTVKLAQKIAEALVIVHSAGLLHRDISPDNIMLCGGGKIKLIDFGAARKYTQTLAAPLTVMMKTGFTAAEQYSPTGNFGAWTDIYSLGAVMFYSLTGKVPESVYSRMQNDEGFAAGLSEVPEKLKEVVLKAAGIVGKERYESAISFKEALAAVGIAPAEIEIFPKNSEQISKNPTENKSKNIKKAAIIAAASAAVAASVSIPSAIMASGRAGENFVGETSVSSSPITSNIPETISSPDEISPTDKAPALRERIALSPQNTEWKSASFLSSYAENGQKNYVSDILLFHFTWKNWSGYDYDSDGKPDEKMIVRWGDIKDNLSKISFNADENFPADRDVKAAFYVTFLDEIEDPLSYYSGGEVSVEAMDEITNKYSLGRYISTDEGGKMIYFPVSSSGEIITADCDFSALRPDGVSNVPDEAMVESVWIKLVTDRFEGEENEKTFSYRSEKVAEKREISLHLGPGNNTMKYDSPFLPVERVWSENGEEKRNILYESRVVLFHYGWKKWLAAENETEELVRFGEIKDFCGEISFDVDENYPANKDIKAGLEITFLGDLSGVSNEAEAESRRYEGCVRLANADNNDKFVKTNCSDNTVSLCVNFADLSCSEALSEYLENNDLSLTDDAIVAGITLVLEFEREENETKAVSYGLRERLG